MRKLIAIPRSLLFAIAFFGMTIPWVLVAYVAQAISRNLFMTVIRGWSRYHRFCARWIVGQRVIFEGELPTGAAFYVLKHESMFETIDLPWLLGMPMIAAKKELLDIPLWGKMGRAYGLLPVDREAGASALRQLRTDARTALAAGRSLCLFPEGTRVEHGDAPPLKSGFAGLYVMIQMPVIPVAVLSGPVNPPGGFLRYPGIVRYRVGEVVPPGLDRKVAEERVHAAINALNTLDDQPTA
ncbi:MAG TPA: lysophospholipid acyltransferase family protein [Sphingobium sp.]|uniref:lysophospholipid acyltransferase family protein n=1 Tax=Sphingobium sp. TaxID=1912891 RepID=UPI002ED123AA